ncbi:MAG: hypothetical protein WAX77_13235 [Methylococcaceae bacterium]
MLKGIIIFILAFSFSTLAYPQTPVSSLLKEITLFKRHNAGKWTITWNPQKTQILLLSKELNYRNKKRKHTPILHNQAALAMAFLKQNAKLFKLTTNLHDLQISRADDDGLVLIRQTFNDLPVIHPRGLNGQIHLRIDSLEGIYYVYNGYMPHLSVSTTPLLSADEIIAIAQEDTRKNRMLTYTKTIGVHPIPLESQVEPFFTQKPKPELIIYIDKEKPPVLAYTFIQDALNRLVHLKYFIDANKGEILLAFDPIIYD